MTRGPGAARRARRVRAGCRRADPVRRPTRARSSSRTRSGSPTSWASPTSASTSAWAGSRCSWCCSPPSGSPPRPPPPRGPAASGRASTSRCCWASSARCVLLFTRAGHRALLRRLGGDDDPAVRADRRLGRRAAAAGHADVLHLHADRLAADAGRRRLGGHPRQLVPDRRADRRRPRLDLAVPGLLRRVLHQGAAVPAARLAADHLPAGGAGDDGAALGRDLQGRRLRPDRDRTAAVRAPTPSTCTGGSSGWRWPDCCTAP